MDEIIKSLDDSMDRLTELLAVVQPSADAGPTEGEKRALLSIDVSRTPTAPQGWHERDSYAQWVEIWRGWPLANEQTWHWEDEDGRAVAAPAGGVAGDGVDRVVDSSRFWPVHCYATVGVGRGMSPDTGSGAELYAVIGHAPRHLDRNIAVVGRVVEGIEHLSSLPRGTGALGFYESAEERVPIVSARLASDLPEGERPRLEVLDTEGDAFARYAAARASRRDPFFIVPAGGADVCNLPVPVRRAGGDPKR